MGMQNQLRSFNGNRSAAADILMKTRGTAKLRRSLSCLQYSAARKSNAAVLLLAVLHCLAT